MTLQTSRVWIWSCQLHWCYFTYIELSRAPKSWQHPMCHLTQHEALLLDLRYWISTGTEIPSTACRMSERRKKMGGKSNWSNSRDLLPTLFKYYKIQMRTKHTCNAFSFSVVFIAHVRDLFDVYFYKSIYKINTLSQHVQGSNSSLLHFLHCANRRIQELYSFLYRLPQL